MSETAEIAWITLEAWWRRQFGDPFMAHLRPGATSAELEELEEEVGVPLPADFKAAYRRHDGQEEWYTLKGEDKLVPGLLYGLPLLTLEAIREELGNWRELLEELIADDSIDEFNQDQASIPPGHVKPLYYNARWVPFADDGGGNFLAIDLDPGPEGVVGQVINMGRDEDTKYVIAFSFGAFLAQVAADYESGNVAIEEEEPGEWSLNIGKPEGTTHYFDALPELFGDA